MEKRIGKRSKSIILCFVLLFIGFLFLSCNTRGSSYYGYGRAVASLGRLITFFVFVQIGIIVGTIVLAVKKGYSGVLAFLLGLFIPLLGSLIIIALLPDNNTVRYSSTHDTTYDSMQIKGDSYLHTTIGNNTVEESKSMKCKNCGIRVSTDKYKCPKCGGTDFFG